MTPVIRNAHAHRLAAMSLTLLLGACSSNPDRGPSAEYEESTADYEAYRCPSGHVLTCEAKRTGRIRFGKMKNRDLDSCSCEIESGVPINSPVPGLY
jgi:hypothetical protein